MASKKMKKESLTDFVQHGLDALLVGRAALPELGPAAEVVEVSERHDARLQVPHDGDVTGQRCVRSCNRSVLTRTFFKVA